MSMRLPAAGFLVAAALIVCGCDRTAETPYEKAVEAQAELEKAREEAAEKVAEAEAEAVETVHDARQEAKEDLQQTKKEAAELVRDAEEDLQEQLDKLADAPLEPAAEPTQEREIIVERKVVVEPAEPAVEQEVVETP